MVILKEEILKIKREWRIASRFEKRKLEEKYSNSSTVPRESFQNRKRRAVNFRKDPKWVAWSKGIGGERKRGKIKKTRGGKVRNCPLTFYFVETQRI